MNKQEEDNLREQVEQTEERLGSFIHSAVSCKEIIDGGNSTEQNRGDLGLMAESLIEADGLYDALTDAWNDMVTKQAGALIAHNASSVATNALRARETDPRTGIGGVADDEATRHEHRLRARESEQVFLEAVRQVRLAAGAVEGFLNQRRQLLSRANEHLRAAAEAAAAAGDGGGLHEGLLLSFQ